jgi:hypothetical protein
MSVETEEPDRWERAKRAIEGMPVESPNAVEGPDDEAYRCGVCAEEFVSHTATWKHIQHFHKDVPREQIAAKVIAPRSAESVPSDGQDVARGVARGGRSPAILLAHWHHLIEGLQTSALDFYTALDSALDRRAIPDAARSRIDYREAGFLSAKREYLRITRGARAADVCAAPFGSGFFVSWWLGEARPSPVIPTIVTFAVRSRDYPAKVDRAPLIGPSQPLPAPTAPAARTLPASSRPDSPGCADQGTTE